MAALVRVGAKLAIAGGAVYVTLNEGIWSSGSFGSKALERVKKDVLPTANDMLDKLPTTNSISDRVVCTWNKGVKATFSTLAESPRLISEYSLRGFNYVRDSMR